jgi:hypothetical protein
MPRLRLVTLPFLLAGLVAGCDPATDSTRSSDDTPSTSSDTNDLVPSLPGDPLIGSWETDIVVDDFDINMTWMFREDGGMKWHIIYPGALAEVLGTWTATDTELTLLDDDCGDLVGVYGWVVTDEPELLTLTAIDDACTGRTDFLVAAPWVPEVKE